MMSFFYVMIIFLNLRRRFFKSDTIFFKSRLIFFNLKSIFFNLKCIFFILMLLNAVHMGLIDVASSVHM